VKDTGYHGESLAEGPDRVRSRSLVGWRGASWHISLLDAARVRRERAPIRWEWVGGASGVTPMKEGTHVAQQTVDYLQQVTWQAER